MYDLFLCIYKNTIQLLSYQLFYAFTIHYLAIIREFRPFIRNFAPQPDEETGSAEEQPDSNMAVPALETVFQEPLRPWAAYLIPDGLFG